MADAKQLAEALRNVRACLVSENEKRNGPICDTIWYGNAETLFDYIDSTLAAHEAQAALAAEPVTDKQLLAEAEFAESYDASAPSFMSLLRDDAVVGDFQRRLLICMRAAVKLAAPVAQAEPWQPIETAPKDGTNVLLLNRKRNVAAGLWMDSASGSGWYLRGGSLGPDAFFNDHHGPTHWMPLPQPPKEQQHG